MKAFFDACALPSQAVVQSGSETTKWIDVLR
jgi:hypothetical protein